MVFNSNRNKDYWTLQLSFYVENIIDGNKITFEYYRIFFKFNYLMIAIHETPHLLAKQLNSHLVARIHLWRWFSLPSILFLAIFLASYLSVCALP